MSAVLAAGPVLAVTTINLTPSTQSHGHGVSSNWTGSWSGTAPYGVTFAYGDGSSAPPLVNTNLTSKAYSHAFFPCTTDTFTQTLRVSDQDNAKSKTSHATETGGNPC